jgi:hypothetical protein
MKALILAALLLAPLPAAAQSLALTGPTGTRATLSAADVAALPRVKVTFDNHGTKQDFEGPLLIDVLAKVGTPKGADIHGAELATVVLVTAKDGYQVAIGLAEADPGTRANRIILADRVGGAPLAANAGPFQMVIEGDVRPARSARMVAAIEVRRLSTAKPADH